MASPTRPKPQHLAATLVVLLAVRDGKSQAWVADYLGVNRSNACRRFQVLEREKLIEKEVRSSIKLYHLSQAGLTLLQHLLKGLGERNIRHLLQNPKEWAESFRWHHLLFRFLRENPVIMGEEALAKGFKTGTVGVVSGFVKRIENCKVLVSGASVLVFSDPVNAPSAYEAIEQGVEQACRAVGVAERLLPWLKTNARFELCRQQLALKGPPAEWIPKGFSYDSDRLVIDFSEGPPEVETVHRSLTIDDMLTLARSWDDIIRFGGIRKMVEEMRKRNL